MTGQPWNFSDSLYHIVSAQTVLLHHILQVILRSLQRFNGSNLAWSSRTGTDIFLQLDHISDQFLRSSGVANTPAGHSIRFGKAVNDQRALLHSGQGGKSSVCPPVKEDMLIYLVC